MQVNRAYQVHISFWTFDFKLLFLYTILATTVPIRIPTITTTTITTTTTTTGTTTTMTTTTTTTATTTTTGTPCACSNGCVQNNSTHTHCTGCGYYGFSIHSGNVYGCSISAQDSSSICYYNGVINYGTYCSLGLCTTGTIFDNNALCV